MIDVHALSGAYAIDALDDTERHHFEAHLAECADCRDEVASLREAGAMLSLASEISPPSSLRDRVLADIAVVRPLPPQVSSLDEHRRRRSRRLAPLVAAAATVAAIGLGAAWHPWTDEGNGPVGPSQPPVTSTLTAAERVVGAPDAETHSRAVETGGSITAVRSRDLGQAAVVASGLDTLPETKIYELWLRLDGEMVPAGFMRNPDSAVLLTGDATDAEAVGITVEQAGGAPDGVPTTQPIAYFALKKV